ncbi:MAG: HEAT repeat domain-containing protein [Chloroflexota bacterium]
MVQEIGKSDQHGAGDTKREIERHLGRLYSPNWQTRKDAVTQLGRLHAGLLPVSGIACQDVNSEVRAAAATVLGSQKSYLGPGEYEQLVSALLSAIDDPVEQVACAAVSSLGLLSAGVAREQIAQCLEYSGNPSLVAAAVLALGRMGEYGLADRLAGYMDSKDVNLVIAGMRAVGELRYLPAAPKVTSILQQVIERAKEMAALELSTGAARYRWRKDVELAGYGAWALAAMEYTDAEPVLIEAAQVLVGARTKVVSALVRLGSTRAAALLESMLQDPSAKLRAQIIRLFLNSDYRQGLPIVRQLLEDPQPPTRHAALGAIVAWRDTASIPVVRRMSYSDPSTEIRPHALAVLLDLAGTEAIPDLAALTADLNLQVRYRAGRLLADLSSSTLPSYALAALDRFHAEFGEVDSRTSSSEESDATAASDLVDRGIVENRQSVSPLPAASDLVVNLDSPLKVARAAIKLIREVLDDPAVIDAELLRLFLDSVDEGMGRGTVGRWSAWAPSVPLTDDKRPENPSDDSVS